MRDDEDDAEAVWIEEIVHATTELYAPMPCDEAQKHQEFQDS